MYNPRDIIIRPIVTEKSLKLMDEENKYTFEVAKGSNKTQIKLAIEEIFDVKVTKVNVMNCKPTTKRFGRHMGTTKFVRKAIVKLAEGNEINLFSEE